MKKQLKCELNKFCTSLNRLSKFKPLPEDVSEVVELIKIDADYIVYRMNEDSSKIIKQQ